VQIYAPGPLKTFSDIDITSQSEIQEEHQAFNNNNNSSSNNLD